MRTLVPLFVCAASLSIAGTITNGVSTYTTGTLPTSETSTAPTVDFRPSGGTTTDHLYSNWWYYRVGSDTRERPIGTYTKSGGSGTIATTEISSGDTSTFTITERDGSANIRFTAVLAMVLSSGPNLRMSFSVTNSTLAPLQISLFNYIDADIQDSAGDDSASFFAPNVVRASDSGGLSFYHSAVSPTAYQVTSYNTLQASLVDGSVTTLNNTGAPFGPGDFTGAWQWDLLIAPSESATVSGGFSSEPPAPMETPEPSSLALVALGAAVLAAARSRR